MSHKGLFGISSPIFSSNIDLDLVPGSRKWLHPNNSLNTSRVSITASLHTLMISKSKIFGNLFKIKDGQSRNQLSSVILRLEENLLEISNKPLPEPPGMILISRLLMVVRWLSLKIKLEKCLKDFQLWLLKLNSKNTQEELSWDFKSSTTHHK
jgi:hypothetical protein